MEGHPGVSWSRDKEYEWLYVTSMLNQSKEEWTSEQQLPAWDEVGKCLSLPAGLRFNVLASVYEQASDNS